MVRTEPPTPRRPAAPSPVRPTQRPGAGRPPPAPPPAARGICPRAGPGHREAKLRRHLRADGAQCGGGRVGTPRGGGARGPAPAPPRPRAARASAPRAAWEGGRARALEASPWPRLCPRKLRPPRLVRPPRSVQTPAVLPLSCPPAPPTRKPERAGRAGPGHVRLGGSSGRARRDPAGRRLGLQSTPLPWPSQIRLPLWTGEASSEGGQAGGRAGGGHVTIPCWVPGRDFSAGVLGPVGLQCKSVVRFLPSWSLHPRGNLYSIRK